MTDVDVTHLPALDLATVDRIAALQTRIDRTYVVPTAAVEQLLREVDAHVLEIDGRRSSRYRSTYFDTPAIDAYLAAARRRPLRWKVRTRAYVDDGTTWLEVKRRDRRGRTLKHRTPHRLPTDELGADGRSFIRGFPGLDGIVDLLQPVLTTSYVRTTLILGASRLTSDGDVRCATATGRVVGIAGSVVETKSSRSGSAADRLLWTHGLRPCALSKYGVGMAALDPELPANRWHRTLQRHVVTR